MVLPAASGKSKIVEEDIKYFAKTRPDFKGLILVPGINTLADWEARIEQYLPELENKIQVRTYAYMMRHYTEVPSDYFSIRMG